MRYVRGTCDPVVVRREEKKSGALLLRRRHGSRPVRYGDLEQDALVLTRPHDTSDVTQNSLKLASLSFFQ